MPPALISSTKNRHVVAAARLKKGALRERDRRFLAEGAQAVREAVLAGAAEIVFHVAGPGEAPHPEAVRAEQAGIRVVAVSEPVMSHLTSTVTPQGILAVARFVDVPLEELPSAPALVPVLCAVRDPGNAGTVLRSADAAGADAVVFAGSSVDVYNSKTVRASAGSLFHLPVVRNAPEPDAVALLRARGLQVLAADAAGGTTVYRTDLARPTAVLFGNEAWGLTPELLALADETVRVPIRGRAESLNLAAAAALFLFEASRQQAAAQAGAAPAGGESLAATVAAAAHDLRSPLATLKGFAATLAERWDRLDDRSRGDLLGGLAVDAERTAALVKLLVDQARVERGTFSASRQRHDVAEEAAWVAKVFARSPDFPDVSVSGGAEARVDADRLQAMLVGLCETAAWWGDEGPVEISIEEAGDRVVIEVSRKGEGAEEPPALLEDPAAGGGRVLPYLVRRLAEAQGGTLSCQGDGVIRFRLSLPREPA